MPEPVQPPDRTRIDALHAKLNAGYGFRVPRALPVAIAASEGLDLTESFHLAWWTYQLPAPWPRHRSIDSQYSGFVPEFFTIASPGVDGMQYGYVVHAPELDLDELPVFLFDPPYEWVEFAADDLQTMLADLGAEAASDEGEPAPLPAYSAVARALGLPPVPGPAPASNQRRPFRPRVPPGWRYVETEDGIGALAPAETFGDDEHAVPVDLFRQKYCDVSTEEQIRIRRLGQDPLAGAADMMRSLLHACRDVLARGYPGTALVGIRRTYRAMDDTGGASDEEKAEMFGVWAEVYEALDRPLLAEVVCDALAMNLASAEKTRWNITYGRFLQLSAKQRERVSELTGPHDSSEQYKQRFAAAVEAVERDIPGQQS